MIPLRTDSPLRTTPYMNWALIAANAVMFVLQVVVPSDGPTRRWFDPLVLNAADPGLWQYVSYAFLHGGVLHLLSNMLFLYIFGNNVNDKMGHLGYLGFYLGGAVAAGIAFRLSDGGTVVGASGGVAAVTGAYMILFPRARVTVLNVFFIIAAFEIPSVYFVLFFFVQDLYFNFSGAPEVAYSAHIGGTLFGVTVSISLLAAHLLPRDQFDVVALIKQWNRRRQYRDAVSGGWDPYVHSGGAARGNAGANGGGGWVGGGTGGATAQPADPRTGRVHDLRGAISDAVAAHDLPRAADLYVDLKQLDPAQVLPRQAQLDVANQLTNQQRYPQAAEAYELFLRHYPKFEQIEQVELMLGIIYARYLERYDRAREVLLKATARLHGQRELDMARTELARIEPLLAARPAGT